MEWFRQYDDELDDATIQGLPDDLFKCFANLRLLANRQRRRGYIPNRVSDIAFALRVLDVDYMGSMVDDLIGRGLLDEAEGHLVPRDWDMQQFASDSSTPRVQEFRERQRASRNVTGGTEKRLHETLQGVTGRNDETVAVTPQIRSDSESDQIQNKGRDARAHAESSFQPDGGELDFDGDDGGEATRRDSAANGFGSAQPVGKAVPIPAAWKVTRDDLEWARGIGFEGGQTQLQVVADDFVDHYRGKGRRSADWHAEFRRWVRREVRDYQKPGQAVANGRVRPELNGNGSAAGADGDVIVAEAELRKCGYEGCSQLIMRPYCLEHGDLKSGLTRLKAKYEAKGD